MVVASVSEREFGPDLGGALKNLATGIEHVNRGGLLRSARNDDTFDVIAGLMAKKCWFFRCICMRGIVL